MNLSIAPGEIFGLLGPNGAGKTTTIRCSPRCSPAHAGSVARLRHRRGRAADARSAGCIGYVPQQLSADAALTGRENVELFARLFDVPRAAARGSGSPRRSTRWACTTPPTGWPATYSGGMVRRLELAQALVNAPRLLVLDEPTVGLDPIARGVVWEHIARLRAEHRDDRADDHPLHGRGRRATATGSR